MDESRPLQSNEGYSRASRQINEQLDWRSSRDLKETTRTTSDRLSAALLAAAAVIDTEDAVSRAERARMNARESLRRMGRIEAPEGHVFLVVVNETKNEYTVRGTYFSRGSCSMGVDSSGLTSILTVEEGDNRLHAFVAGSIDPEVALERHSIDNGDYGRDIIAEVFAHKKYSADERLRKIVITETEPVYLVPIDQIPDEFVLLNEPNSTEVS